LLPNDAPRPEPAPKAAGAKKPATAARVGSKTEKILDLLKRPGGVSLKELVKATGWQPHSVRGFLSGTVGRKMGTPVESFKSTEGDRSYRLSAK
jgi:predicted ArsR family transcriptional regulator